MAALFGLLAIVFASGWEVGGTGCETPDGWEVGSCEPGKDGYTW